MEARVKVFDKGHVAQRLRNFATLVPEEARKVMNRTAAAIVKLAKLQAPRDTGALEESIRIVKTYGVRGRVQIDIVAGGPEMVQQGERMVDLTEYAAAIHEHYEEIHPVPGRNTQAKMLANPHIQIGSKFLSRASDAYRERLSRALIVSINDVIRRESTR